MIDDPRPRYWLLHYEDPDRPLETFNDYTAAKAQYDRVRDNWNCTLFVEWGETGIDRELLDPLPFTTMSFALRVTGQIDAGRADVTDTHDRIVGDAKPYTDHGEIRVRLTPR